MKLVTMLVLSAFGLIAQDERICAPGTRPEFCGFLPGAPPQVEKPAVNSVGSGAWNYLGMNVPVVHEDTLIPRVVEQQDLDVREILDLIRASLPYFVTSLLVLGAIFVVIRARNRSMVPRRT